MSSHRKLDIAPPEPERLEPHELEKRTCVVSFRVSPAKDAWVRAYAAMARVSHGEVWRQLADEAWELRRAARSAERAAASRAPVDRRRRGRKVVSCIHGSPGENGDSE